ncbi:hypothetical protein K1X76_00365 [bacterium]|nr:hypothetical protein [bacterium]
MIMKTIPFFALLAFFSFPVLAQVPTIPQAGASPQNFVPAGYFIKNQAEGDLNGDKLNDLALVLAPDWEKTIDIQPDNDKRDRYLVLAFKNPDNTYKLSAVKGDFIMCKNCGGVFGDPLDNLSIERGAVVVSFYGGSRDRWGQVYRLRYQNNDWYLIGYTDSTNDGLELSGTKVDVNWSTGVLVTEVQKGENLVSSKKETRKLPAVKLSELNIQKIQALIFKK